MVKIGLRAHNFPVPEETALLYEHIYENYPNNRIEEIRLAFDLAIAGKLSLKPDEVKCYENFSCAYVSTIMNAYILWARERSNDLQEISIPEPVALLEGSKITDTEIDNYAREDAEKQYQKYLRSQQLWGLELNRSILLKDGLMKDTGCTCKHSVLQFFRKRAEAGHKNIYIKTS